MSNPYYDEKQDVLQENFNVFMSKVYGLMFMGLIITAATGYAFSYLILNNRSVAVMASSSAFFYTVTAIQFILVIFLSARIGNISEGFARLMFLLYALVLGVFLSYIFIVYAMMSIVSIFAVTAGVFAVMSVYGSVTKSDLTSAGKLFITALIGIIIASVVNFFLKNSMLDFVLCVLGLGVFLGLVAYDTQKIRTRYYEIQYSAGAEMTDKYVVIAALSLYLDFINIFLRLLRLFGKKK